MHHHVDRLSATVRAHAQPVQQDRVRFAQGLADDADQRFAQAFAGHGMDVDVGLARGRFEVLTGAATDVEDVALAIDQHSRRSPGLLDQLVGQFAKVVGA